MSTTKKRRRRLTNRQMLIKVLTRSYVDRTDPELKRKKDGTIKWETSHLQSMAHHFAEQLEKLSRGRPECRLHDGQVVGACAYCDGLWAEGDEES